MKIFISLLSLIIFLASCESFLDTKPDAKLAVPKKLIDFRSLLNSHMMNFAAAEGSVMARDYFLKDEEFISLTCDGNRTLYLFADEVFEKACDGITGWADSYQKIFRSNVVLMGIDKFEKQYGVSKESSEIRGHALFARAISYFELLPIWADSYDPLKLEGKLGIPLKFTDDYNEKTVRSSLKESFAQVLSDLNAALHLLPEQAANLVWPSRIAICAYLARVSLYMQDFENAAKYSQMSINSSHKLLDYRTISSDKVFPFPERRDNPEIIHIRALKTNYSSIQPFRHRISQELLELYDKEDLRRELYFTSDQGRIWFRGNFIPANGALFTGVTIGEMYLILAECQARLDKKSEAMATLKVFLKNRGVDQPLLREADILVEILKERQKELVCRGLDFADVKRLNVSGAGISLRRVIQGKEYILGPNDPRFTLLIPEAVIRISGIQQNVR